MRVGDTLAVIKYIATLDGEVRYSLSVRTSMDSKYHE